MRKLVLLLSLLAFFLSSCSIDKVDKKENISDLKLEVATFAGGCFWCTESDFEKVEGVKKVISGYAGGEKPNPTYEDVSSGETKYREAVQVYYDPEIVSYEELLDFFWRHNDPTDKGGSFVDRGFQYTTAIFYKNEKQKNIAKKSLKKINQSGIFEKPIVTKIIPLTTFSSAEEYHQDYYKKNPIRYKFYRRGSGRDEFIKQVWQ